MTMIFQEKLATAIDFRDLMEVSIRLNSKNSSLASSVCPLSVGVITSSVPTSQSTASSIFNRLKPASAVSTIESKRCLACHEVPSAQPTSRDMDPRRNFLGCESLRLECRTSAFQFFAGKAYIRNESTRMMWNKALHPSMMQHGIPQDYLLCARPTSQTYLYQHIGVQKWWLYANAFEKYWTMLNHHVVNQFISSLWNIVEYPQLLRTHSHSRYSHCPVSFGRKANLPLV